MSGGPTHGDSAADAGDQRQHGSADAPAGAGPTGWDGGRPDSLPRDPRQQSGVRPGVARVPGSLQRGEEMPPAWQYGADQPAQRPGQGDDRTSAFGPTDGRDDRTSAFGPPDSRDDRTSAFGPPDSRDDRAAGNDDPFRSGGGRPSLAAWAAAHPATDDPAGGGRGQSGQFMEHGAGTDDNSPAQPPRKRRRGLMIGIGVTVVLILLAAAGVVITMKLNSSTTYAVGDCVRQDGSGAKKVNCTDAGAFAVVSKVDNQEKCPDANQPYVVLKPDGGNEEVLCLRPAAQK